MSTVGHIQNFHCVFSGHTASSALMATCVTLTDLTDWSLVKNFSKNCVISVMEMAEKLAAGFFFRSAPQLFSFINHANCLKS